MPSRLTLHLICRARALNSLTPFAHEVVLGLDFLLDAAIGDTPPRRAPAERASPAYNNPPAVALASDVMTWFSAMYGSVFHILIFSCSNDLLPIFACQAETQRTQRTAALVLRQIEIHEFEGCGSSDGSESFLDRYFLFCTEK